MKKFMPIRLGSWLATTCMLLLGMATASPGSSLIRKKGRLAPCFWIHSALTGLLPMPRSNPRLQLAGTTKTSLTPETCTSTLSWMSRWMPPIDTPNHRRLWACSTCPPAPIFSARSWGSTSPRVQLGSRRALMFEPKITFPCRASAFARSFTSLASSAVRPAWKPTRWKSLIAPATSFNVQNFPQLTDNTPLVRPCSSSHSSTESGPALASACVRVTRVTMQAPASRPCTPSMST
mmetsp:Transcript_45937/g.137275  ORF Transcript_45937/g.137275 Transcript_45937/m.137275 type:complete len:235 (+) Transcript_45937:292-996(+)